jgi:uncharacterized protein (DUF58 family)
VQTLANIADVGGIPPPESVGWRPDATREGASAWHGTGWRHRRRAPTGRRWRHALWSVLLPSRGTRVWPTLPGFLLGAVVLGLGAAAYNTANNILFITLSLLLSCLLLGGLLLWLNFRRLAWRLRLPPALRAGTEQVATVEIRNDRHVLPAYALWFELSAAPAGQAAPPAPLPRARELLSGRSWRADAPERVALRGRLDPGEQAGAEWRLRPARRGVLRVALESAGSVFPFGFLTAAVGIGLEREAPVWPATVDYRQLGGAAAWRPRPGARRANNGPRSDDLRAVRRYAPGDPPRRVHWKATARTRRLMVREFAAEREDGVVLWLQTSAERWPREEQFELLCGLAGTLAEDLFQLGRLRALVVNAAPPARVRGARDVEAFLDQLAVVTRTDEPDTGASQAGRGIMTFAPDGARGVIAYVDGTKAASA